MNLETSSPKQKYRHLCHLVRLARRYTRIARSVAEALDKHQALDEFTTYHAEIWQLANDIQDEAEALYKSFKAANTVFGMKWRLDTFAGLHPRGDKYLNTLWAIRQYTILCGDGGDNGALRVYHAFKKDEIHHHFLHRRLLAQDKQDARRLYPNGEIPF